MSLVRKTREELKDFRLTPAQRARLDALTDAEITAAAKSDPDNPPIGAAEFKRMRRPGRPPLAASERKVQTTLRLDRKVVEHFRAKGRGWQTRISEVLLRAIGGGGDKLVYVKHHKKLYAKKFSVNKSKASKPKAAKRRPKRKGAHPGRGR